MVRYFKGWSLLILVSMATALFTLGYPAAIGFSVEALRWGLHATARISAMLFLLAFTASAAVTLFPNAFTRWQIANRRMLGLGFAFSHLVHAGFIVAFSMQGPAEYAEAITPGMIGVGAVGYTLIVLMAATSFRPVAEWVGAKSWRLIHMIGVHWLALQFIIAFGKRIPTGGTLYAGFTALFVLAIGLRLYASRQRGKHRARKPA